MRMSLCESTVTSHSVMMCIFPRTFMTLRNGLWPVKDSLTVPLYCQADLRLAQIVSLESSTVSIKCYDQFRVPPNLNILSILHLLLYFFHIWWVIEIPPPLRWLIIVSIWNNIYSALIWKQKCFPIHTTLLKISQTKTCSSHSCAHSLKAKHPFYSQKCTFSHANTVRPLTYIS